MKYLSILLLVCLGCSSMQERAESPTGKAVMTLVSELRKHPEYVKTVEAVVAALRTKNYASAIAIAKEAAMLHGTECPDLYSLLDLLERVAQHVK